MQHFSVGERIKNTSERISVWASNDANLGNLNYAHFVYLFDYAAHARSSVDRLLRAVAPFGVLHH